MGAVRHWEVVAGLLADPIRGAEVGVRAGNTTRYLLGRFPSLTIYAVDLWTVLPSRDRPGYQTYSDWNFESIHADFREKVRSYGERCIELNMDSVEAAGHVEDGSLDFVFIDAEHTYEGVTRDIQAWRPKVRRGGILCGHDYGHPRFPGVKLAVDAQFPVRVKETVWSLTV